jgi:hypothetical protein
VIFFFCGRMGMLEFCCSYCVPTKFPRCFPCSQCIPQHVPNSFSRYPISFALSSNLENLWYSTQRKRLQHIYFGNVQSLIFFYDRLIKDAHHNLFFFFLLSRFSQLINMSHNLLPCLSILTKSFSTLH